MRTEQLVDVERARAEALKELLGRYQTLIAEDLGLLSEGHTPKPPAETANSEIVLICSSDTETRASRPLVEAGIRNLVGYVTFPTDEHRARQVAAETGIGVVEVDYSGDLSELGSRSIDDGKRPIAFSNRYERLHATRLAARLKALENAGEIPEGTRIPYVALFRQPTDPAYRRVNSRQAD